MVMPVIRRLRIVTELFDREKGKGPVKNYLIYQFVIVVVSVVRFVKLLAGRSHPTPYAIDNGTTFLIYVAILIVFLFANIDKYYRIAVIILILSNILEYAAILMPSSKVIIQNIDIFVVLLSVGFAITSIVKTRSKTAPS